MVFNREEIEKFFRFLNHENLTETRIIDPREGGKTSPKKSIRKFDRDYGIKG